MSKKSETIQLPSLLSFERKLETSDSIMYAGNWGKYQDAENKKEQPSDTESDTQKPPKGDTQTFPGLPAI